MEEKQDLYKQRLEKLARIREVGEEPFKYSYERSHTIRDATEKFEGSAHERDCQEEQIQPH